MQRSRAILHELDTMAVRIGHGKIDVAIATLIDFLGNGNSLRLQVDAKRFEVCCFQRDVGQSIFLIRWKGRKDFDVLPITDLEIGERDFAVLCEDLEWLVVAEQFTIKLASLL